MKTTEHGWNVLDEDAGILVYEYEFTKGSTSNAMTARMADGSLLVLSPPCGVEDGVYRELESFGGVTALVGVNGLHHLGLPAWHEAFPSARIYASEVAAKRIQRRQPALPKIESAEALAEKVGEGVRVHTVPGINNGELWLQVGSTWYVSDGFFNMQSAPSGFMGFLFKWTQSGPGFRVNGLQRAVFVRDKPGYKRWVLAQLDQALPDVVVPAHGAIEESSNVGAQMRALIEQRF